jgi:hypothetical protein
LYQIQDFYFFADKERWRRRKMDSRSSPNPLMFNNAATKMFSRFNAVGGWMKRARIHAFNANHD